MMEGPPMAQLITPQRTAEALVRGCRKTSSAKVVVKRKAVLLALKAEVEGVADAEARAKLLAQCEATTVGNIEVDAALLLSALTSLEPEVAADEADEFDAALAAADVAEANTIDDREAQ
jgi:hypothetical protein